MKLEDLLKAELYKQIETKIKEVNAKEPDKLKHVRYADLSEGEYVSKEKYSVLEADATAKATELSNAEILIDNLKKGTVADTTLQTKIADYELEILKLKGENELEYHTFLHHSQTVYIMQLVTVRMDGIPMTLLVYTDITIGTIIIHGLRERLVSRMSSLNLVWLQLTVRPMIIMQ